MEYKILIIKNRYQKKLSWGKGIEWFAKNTPLKVITEEVSTDWDLSFRSVGNATFQGVVADGYQDHVRCLVPEGKYHAVCLVYGNDAPGIRVSITEDAPLYRDTDLIQVVKESDSGNTFNHETIHTFFKKLARKGLLLQDPMDTYIMDSSLTASPSNRTMALELLKPYWGHVTDLEGPGVINKIISAITPPPTYLYFTAKEVLGLKVELVKRLDNLRGICGFPFRITSGLRDVAHNNALADSVTNSAHLDGEAVDIAISDSAKRMKIVSEALKMGFKRIGVGKTFVHLDISNSRPQDVMWHYYP